MVTFVGQCAHVGSQRQHVPKWSKEMGRSNHHNYLPLPVYDSFLGCIPTSVKHFQVRLLRHTEDSKQYPPDENLKSEGAKTIRIKNRSSAVS